MHADGVRATAFRCYERVETRLAPGLTAIVGPNGAGKTSLIEAVHFGLLAWSPRTSDEARMVRDGDAVTRVEVQATVQGTPVEVTVGFQPGTPKRIRVDGVGQRSADRLGQLFAVLVFTPDRLAVVKGAPAIRRLYVDRAVARLWPRYAAIAADYGRALQQRNQLLRRIRSGVSSVDSLSTWTAQVAQLGGEVAGARIRLIERLAEPFAAHLAALGGDPGPAALRYKPYGPTTAEEIAAELDRRIDRDVERVQTGAGPHRDDVALSDRDRDVRAFGSQGEQRTALLALLLAEADLVHEVRGLRPLLLLDDVASELDAERRLRLLAAVRERGQAIVTTTQAADLGDVDLLLHVEHGRVEAA